MRTQFFVSAGLMAIAACVPALAQRMQEPVTRDQYIASQKERFTRMDANGDGVVTKDEISAQMAKRMGNAPPSEMIDALFKRIDTDGDGKATLAEATAAAGAQFDAWDTNKDGTLTPEERRAGQMGMMQGMQRPQ
ncbi:EF-hand domain-containing protein [Sphingomonas sp. MMS24-J13]|uniref:EF-hand domain-containing protein n=1 Tax=Sphingomonas sp. MMS24-J13 TaxID=3238686 RepID=UPI00384F95F5